MVANVALVLCRGTIEALGVGRLDLASYSDTGQRLGPGGLVAQIPELLEAWSVREFWLDTPPSQAWGQGELLNLRAQLASLASSGDFDGIVVTQGTNTLEEIAYFLHLTVAATVPIVVTGAIRPASALSADGPLNLVNAARVATARLSRGLGVLVTMNDRIFGARDVTKGAGYRVDAFEGRDLGPLGYIDTDRVAYYHRPIRRVTARNVFEPSLTASLPRVDVVVSHLQADGRHVECAIAAGCDGIVSAGTGGGAPTLEEAAALEAASNSGVVICQASRVGSGRIVKTAQLARHGWVVADNLPPWKARILLQLALTRTRNPRLIQRIFDSY
jgi:L-asparaginase